MCIRKVLIKMFLCIIYYGKSFRPPWRIIEWMVNKRMKTLICSGRLLLIRQLSWYMSIHKTKHCNKNNSKKTGAIVGVYSYNGCCRSFIFIVIPYHFYLIANYIIVICQIRYVLILSLIRFKQETANIIECHQ